jgi:Domain of unknown function (DUF4404)
MIRKTIGDIEQRIRDSRSISEQARSELLNMLGTLKTEVETLASTDDEQAESITRFTDVSTHEAFREGKNPRLMELSREGLAASVDGFEQSHPKLVELVNRICTTLSNLGV